MFTRQVMSKLSKTISQAKLCLITKRATSSQYVIQQTEAWAFVKRTDLLANKPPTCQAHP